MELEFIESQLIGGKPNPDYLTKLFENNGLMTAEGRPIKNVPLLRLCAFRDDDDVAVDEVLAT